jgi:hypothetical protein
MDPANSPRKPVPLLADLQAFVQHHGAHGPLTADATEPAWNGYLLAVTCSCGITFERWVTPEDAELGSTSVRAAELGSDARSSSLDLVNSPDRLA